MKYIATYKNKPLSTFFPNGNGRVKDIISFSGKSFQLFNSPNDVENHLEFKINWLKSRNGIDKSLVDKILNIVSKIKIVVYSKS